MIYGKADEVQVPSLDLLTFLFGMLSPLALSFTPDGMTPCRHVDVCVTSCPAFFMAPRSVAHLHRSTLT